jgi:hypothetical protein
LGVLAGATDIRRKFIGLLLTVAVVSLGWHLPVTKTKQGERFPFHPYSMTGFAGVLHDAVLNRPAPKAEKPFRICTAFWIEIKDVTAPPKNRESRSATEESIWSRFAFASARGRSPPTVI